jgi:hypothetical protein
LTIFATGHGLHYRLWPDAKAWVSYHALALLRTDHFSSVFKDRGALIGPKHPEMRRWLDRHSLTRQWS